MSHTHVKVARCIIDPTDGKEIIKNINQGGEAQLWDLKTWKQYHDFIEQNKHVRGTTHYPWTFIEYITPPNDDLRNYVILPEKTGGKEFQINTNAKN